MTEVHQNQEVAGLRHVIRSNHTFPRHFKELQLLLKREYSDEFPKSNL